ncbi:MAG: cupredoxin domain-containing protein [Methanoregula sp.]|nr:cupredoxin domain-containing protein [Methanoregula sp.]
MRPIPVLLLIALLPLLTCGCSESPPAQPVVTPTVAPPIPSQPVTTTLPSPVFTPTRTASVSDNTITMVKNSFQPANMTVKVGSTVRWVNADDHPHRIEFEDKSFSASTYLLGASQSASSLPFRHPGLYNYSCMIHPEMQGTITVEA